MNNDDVRTKELFDTLPILEKKLGTDPFDEIPQEPGIYRFYDKKGTLLYVGKAKNLRRRLFTYKRARPGKTSRKESKLISQIERFEFDVLETEEDAILQENRWIREYRPEFNHANKHTETYYFITVQRFETAFMFGLLMNPSGQLQPERSQPLYRSFSSALNTPKDSKTFGCFKGHRTVRLAFGSMLQLLWMNEFGSVSPLFLPVQLSRNLTPMRFKLPLQHQEKTQIDQLEQLVTEWYLGNSTDLLEKLKDDIQKDQYSGFTRKYIDNCFEILENYYERSLRSYRIMRDFKKNNDSSLIDQSELDDLFTRINNIPQLTTESS